ncbi:MAG: murein L,D-transpeptidase catalytic domain family protein [Pseudomonadota bacterium]
MRHVLTSICFGLLAALPAGADHAVDLVGAELLGQADLARQSAGRNVLKQDYMVVIDYRLPSSSARFFLVDLQDRTAEAFLVAHGRGSDPDFDGMAQHFSNIPNSKMTSLGRFVTGETYYGRHGLSLRMHGLDPSNDKAEARAIVIHGADYVSPGRAVLGRSWGCPALERKVAEKLIPDIAGGVFIYAIGPAA